MTRIALVLIALSLCGIARAQSPQALTVTHSDAQIFWTAPTKNRDGSPLTNLAGFHVWHGTAPKVYDATPVQIPPGTLLYTFPTLPNGPHYFAVSAYNAGGEGALSEEVALIVLVSPPSTLTTLGPYAYCASGTAAKPVMTAIGYVQAGLTCGPAVKTVAGINFCQIKPEQADKVIFCTSDKPLAGGAWARAAP